MLHAFTILVKLAKFIDWELMMMMMMVVVVVVVMMMMVTSDDLVIEDIFLETGKSKESNEPSFDKSSQNGGGDVVINSIGIGGE